MDVAGAGCPHGHAVRNPGPVASVAVRLSDTDVAPADSAAGSGIATTSPGFSRWAGAPRPWRVSRTRWGWIPCPAALAGVVPVATAATTTTAATTIDIRRIVPTSM